MVVALGCLAVVAGLMSTAEAGGRKRPGAPTPPQPAGTRVTMVNKTSKNLFTVIYNPPPYLNTVGEAKAVGGKIVNAGATAVFTNLKAGQNSIEVYDVAILGSPITDATSLIFVPSPPGGTTATEYVTAAANQNTTIEITTEAGTNFIVFTTK